MFRPPSFKIQSKSRRVTTLVVRRCRCGAPKNGGPLPLVSTTPSSKAGRRRRQIAENRDELARLVVASSPPYPARPSPCDGGLPMPMCLWPMALWSVVAVAHLAAPPFAQGMRLHILLHIFLVLVRGIGRNIEGESMGRPGLGPASQMYYCRPSVGLSRADATPG